VPPRPEQPEGPPGTGAEPEPRKVDVGKWDGKGGFRSSGALDPGETFTVAFSKAGTYSYACVLHPQMVGTLTVKA
jgi:plastocyanin